MKPNRFVPVAALLLLLMASATSAVEDVTVQTSVSQTALWVGSVVTYTVQLTCRPDVDLLQEDLGADKLTLAGLEVAGHTVRRVSMPDGRTVYDVAYQLTTFEPADEGVGVGDWTVRYVVGSAGRGTAPARELTIPGVALAWRSVLPAALTTLDIRQGHPPQPVPRWWGYTRASGLGLMGFSAAAFVWLLGTRLVTGRPRTSKRRHGREAARDFRGALDALRNEPVATPSARISAYASLEAAVRKHAAEVTTLPAAALTPDEVVARLAPDHAPFSATQLARVLTDCQRARYHRPDQMPTEQEFRATLEAAAELVAR